MTHILGVHHVNLTVTDLDRSVAWYCDVLGLQRGWEVNDESTGHHKVALLVPDSTLRLVLSHHRNGSEEAFDETRTGLDHLAFTVADLADLEEWQRRFESKGVDHSPIKEGATGMLITFRDPDNIQLEMYTVSK